MRLIQAYEKDVTDHFPTPLKFDGTGRKRHLEMRKRSIKETTETDNNRIGR